MTLSKTLVGLIFAFASVQAVAWDGALQGVVVQIDTSADAYGARIYFAGSPEMCGNTNSWAYLPTSNANYQGTMATLITAFALGKAVRLYSNRDSSGYCQIGYASVG